MENKLPNNINFLRLGGFKFGIFIRLRKKPKMTFSVVNG